jgi:hypothetical protein
VYETAKKSVKSATIFEHADDAPVSRAQGIVGARRNRRLRAFPKRRHLLPRVGNGARERGTPKSPVAAERRCAHINFTILNFLSILLMMIRNAGFGENKRSF